MKFNSIPEYFYRLYNRNLVMVIVPLVLFTTFSFLNPKYLNLDMTFIEPEWVNEILLGYCGFIVLFLTTVHWLTRRRIKKFYHEQSLGIRMDKYAMVVRKRFRSATFLLTLSFVVILVTGDIIFFAPLAIVVLWMMWMWPSPGRLCRDLKLNKDETIVVYSRKA